MGRALGAFDRDDEMDRPDLNKCPDCGCFFASDNCPLCGKPCPEAFRAGNRTVVKQKKQYWRASSRGPAFVDWYHQWWFIILMLFMFPLVGIVLLLTSPHKRSLKITFCSILAVLFIGGVVVLGNLDRWIWMAEHDDPAVNTSLSRQDYIAACEQVEPQNYYRLAGQYEGRFVTMTLTVVDRVTDVDAYYYENENINCYRCRDTAGGEYTVIIRDCIMDTPQNFIAGDVITIYGEGAGDVMAYDNQGYDVTAPGINVAYVVLQPK